MIDEQNNSPFDEFSDGANDNTQTTEQPAPLNVQPEVQTKTSLKSRICGIVYPLVFIIMAVIFYVVGLTNIIGLIVSILSSVGLGVLMFVGGFYFYIIPLPFIYMYGFGCDRYYASKGKKIGLGLLCFVLAALSIFMMFIAAW